MEYSQTILKCVDLGQKRCFSGSANIKTGAHTYVKWAGQPPASTFGRWKPHNKLSSEIRHFRAFWFDWETLLHWITWKSYHGQFLDINLGSPHICVHAPTYACAPPHTQREAGATVICCGTERTNTEIRLSVQRQWTAFLTQQQQALSQAEQRHMTLQDSHFPEESQS